MIEAMMQVLHIRDPETGDFKPLAAIKGDVGDKGNSAWIRFSANADGTSFTSTWTSGQQYIGFASAIAEPTDKSAYIWVDLAQIAKSLTDELKTSLEAKLDTEKQARADADASLEDDITLTSVRLGAAEQARIDGQNTLSSRITDLEKDLGTETSNRVNGQNTLSNRITDLDKDLGAEVSARVNQQNTLADRITNLETEFNGDHSEFIQLKSNFTLLAQRVTKLENG